MTAVGAARGKSAIWILVTEAKTGMAGATGGPSGKTGTITTVAVLVGAHAHGRGPTRDRARPRFETGGGTMIGGGRSGRGAPLGGRGRGRGLQSATTAKSGGVYTERCARSSGTRILWMISVLYEKQALMLLRCILGSWPYHAFIWSQSGSS